MGTADVRSLNVVAPTFVRALGAELRTAPLAAWKSYLTEQGFEACGGPIFPDHDPTRNALLLFRKA